MPDELDIAIRKARPHMLTASPEAVARARARAHVVARERSGESQRVGRLRRPIILTFVAATVALAFVGGFLLAPNAGRTAGKVVIENLTPTYGVSLALPAGWSGRIYNEQPSGLAAAAFLQAGNFQLPSNDDDVGSAGAAAMTPNDVFVVLLESLGNAGGFDYRPLSGPPAITRADFGPATEGVPSDHAFARIFFTSVGRRFVLSAQFGSRSVSDEQLRNVNDVLSTLAIQTRR